jgi:hypothetical protein
MMPKRSFVMAAGLPRNPQKRTKSFCPQNVAATPLLLQFDSCSAHSSGLKVVRQSKHLSSAFFGETAFAATVLLARAGIGEFPPPMAQLSPLPSERHWRSGIRENQRANPVNGCGNARSAILLALGLMALARNVSDRVGFRRLSVPSDALIGVMMRREP